MAENVRRRHGEPVYFIAGEGVYRDDPAVAPKPISLADFSRTAKTLAMPLDGAPPGAAAEAAPPIDLFRFVRMFPDLPKFEDASIDGLKALGASMGQDASAPAADHPNLPSGYTYLGQFIDHDITFDGEALEDADANLQDTINKRSPSLDLDSLYGRGPQLSPELYDGDKLKIGKTKPSPAPPQFSVNREFEDDLLRGLNPADPTAGAQPDPRNDENLAVAQTHVAFMKFHNRVVDLGLSFAEARAVVLQHYHAIVWFDFLPRLVDPLVWLDVHQNGRKVFDVNPPTGAAVSGMPVEFSVAAYRMGHSMIRTSYEWNRVFRTGGIVPGTLQLLFQFTGRVNRPGSPLGGPFTTPPNQPAGTPPADLNLPSNWIIDWRRFADFTTKPDIGNPDGFNHTRRLDTHLVEPLRMLPEFERLPSEVQTERSLAVRNLLRGRALGLPSGQDVAAALGLVPLKPEQIRGGQHDAVVQQFGFDTRTPLWFYILREAEVQQAGVRLGAVGSRILLETFHRLIEVSDHSLFSVADWAAHPELKATNPRSYALHDLLDFAFDGDVNPIGDEPIP